MKIWGTKAGVVPDLKARFSTLTNVIVSLPGALHCTALCSRHAPHRGFCTPIHCSASVNPRERVCTWFGNAWRYLKQLHGTQGYLCRSHMISTSQLLFAVRNLCIRFWYSHSYLPVSYKTSGVLSVFKNPYSLCF